ncbi:MAG TPA: glutathione S-transferase family protein [Methylocystis sp.]|nr:glutathione S-transferase family protein [Methylocystis sp.]
MLVLRYSPASPYARKVLIAAAILGLSDRIATQTVDFADPSDSIRTQNPLGKIPTLVLEDGSTLFDSRVIAEYFGYLAGGGKLFPADAGRRFAALRLQALGDGICDAALLLRFEETTRPAEKRSDDWVSLQRGKVERGLAALEAEPPAGETDIGHIAAATALGYLDLRFAGAWREKYPRLVTWLDDFAKATPSFDATKV